MTITDPGLVQDYYSVPAIVTATATAAVLVLVAGLIIVALAPAPKNSVTRGELATYAVLAAATVAFLTALVSIHLGDAGAKSAYAAKIKNWAAAAYGISLSPAEAAQLVDGWQVSATVHGAAEGIRLGVGDGHVTLTDASGTPLLTTEQATR